MSDDLASVFSALEADIKTSLSGNQVYWDSQDLRIGVRVSLEYLGYSQNIIKIYLKVIGSDCFSLADFVKIANLEKAVISSLPFRESTAQKNPKKLTDCSYYLINNEEYADREKKETINYTRRFMLICEIGRA